jgi:D-arginine dehydrogenase
MTVVEADVAVVGAGMGGVSVAHALTASRSVVLIEREKQAAYHTTGRSAAVYLPSYGNATVRTLTADSLAVYEEIGGLLTPRASLWIGRDADALRAFAAGNPVLRPLEASEARALCPVLRPEWCVGALIDPSSSDIDVLGLHQYYLGGARRNGLNVLLNAEITTGRHEGGKWVLDTTAGRVRVTDVVNAAGAWADRVAVALGVPPVGLRPLVRTAAVARAEGVDPGWPLVGDVGETFYFRPEGTGVLLSPADETEAEPHDARPDDLAVALAIERVNEATTLDLRSVRTAWAGLRTFTPDRTPVAGPDPAAPGFHWLAGQGGYGIQLAPALALAVAAALSGAELPAPLSVSRFR